MTLAPKRPEKTDKVWKEPANAPQFQVWGRTTGEIEADKNDKRDVASECSFWNPSHQYRPSTSIPMPLVSWLQQWKTGIPFLLTGAVGTTYTWSPGPCCQWHHCILTSLLRDPITVTMATAIFSHLVAMASTVFCCPSWYLP